METVFAFHGVVEPDPGQVEASGFFALLIIFAIIILVLVAYVFWPLLAWRRKKPPTEIERTFLVNDHWSQIVKDFTKMVSITQAYLDAKRLTYLYGGIEDEKCGFLFKDVRLTSANITELPRVAYRIRKLTDMTNGNITWVLTLKWPKVKLSNKPGSADQALELEREVDSKLGETLLAKCVAKLQKARYTLPSGWEIDVFRINDQEYVIAQIEFPDQRQAIELKLPTWIGEEVTGLKEYGFLNLAVNGWPKEGETNIRTRF